MTSTARVLAVGLAPEALAVLRGWGTTILVADDVHEARRLVEDGFGERPVVVARFQEAEAWALSSLFACVRRLHRQVPILLVTDVPRPALPVLITDLPGLRLLVPGDAQELRTALHDMTETPELVLGRALA